MEHAYGPATELPDLLRQLRSHDEEVREAAVEEISDLVMHQGSSYPAGAAIVPYLLEVFADGSAPGRQEAYDLLVALWPENIDPAEPEPEDYDVSPEERAVRDALRAGVPTLLALLDDDDRDARGYSAHLLSYFPDLGELISPALTARLAVEPDTVIAAALCLTAGLVGDPGDADLVGQVAARRGQGGKIARWTVLMGLARLVAEPDDDMIRDLCDCFFRGPDTLEGWPFYDGSLSTGAAEALQACGLPADEEVWRSYAAG